MVWNEVVVLCEWDDCNILFFVYGGVCVEILKSWYDYIIKVYLLVLVIC